MAKTFSLRRQEIVEKQLGVEELKERWPALFTVDEINAEFLRITTVPLQTRFLASLDRHHSKLIELIRRKGGVNREKTQRLLQALDRSLDANIKRECLLKCLTIYLGEDLDQLFKEYLVVQWEEAEMELSRASMAVFVIREEDDSLQPHEIGVVIDGVKVLNMLPSVAHAGAMLFGLMYVLNLSYPAPPTGVWRTGLTVSPTGVLRTGLTVSPTGVWRTGLTVSYWGVEDWTESASCWGVEDWAESASCWGVEDWTESASCWGVEDWAESASCWGVEDWTDCLLLG
uniref:Uncharacterized protein n=1 Tax=Knipowitschia caucasica TaxID=637954 RepID=A0AAV2LHB8_KNICA